MVDSLKDGKIYAVIYLAWGESFLAQALESYQFSKQHLPKDVYLITDKSTLVTEEVGVVFKIIRADFKTKGLLRKSEMITYLPDGYDGYLYLDTDTKVLHTIELGFCKILHHDVAMSHAPHYSLDQFFGFSKIMKSEGSACLGQLQYNSGVIFFTNSDRVKMLFSEWRRLGEKYPESLSDQSLLSLAMDSLNFNPYNLSISFNYRGFGDPVSGVIRIWHSHHEFPREINDFVNPWPPRRVYPEKVEYLDSRNLFKRFCFKFFNILKDKK